MSAILFLTLSCALGAVDSTSPLIASSTEVNLGEVVSGVPVKCSFRVVHARRTGPVRIQSVTGTCGCSVSESDRRELAAGESSTIQVTVFTAGQPAGPNRWKVTVRTTHQVSGQRQPVESVLELFVVARLRHRVSVEPSELRMTVPAGRIDAPATEHELTLRGPADGEFRVIGTTSSTERIRVESVESKGSEARVRLQIAGNWPVGDRHEVVSIRTSAPELPLLAVPVRVVAHEPTRVWITPSAVEFRPSPGSGPMSRLVQIRLREGTPIEIGACRSADPRVKVVWPEGRHPVGTIRVKLDGENTSEPGKTEIRVELVQPEGESVVIPVNWRTP